MRTTADLLLRFPRAVLIGCLALTVLLGLVAVMMVPFLYTLSRSSYLALVPSFFVLLLMARRYVLVGMAAGILLLGLAMPELFLPAAVLERVESTFTGQGTSAALGLPGRFDASTEARIYNARMALDARGGACAKAAARLAL